MHFKREPPQAVSTHSQTYNLSKLDGGVRSLSWPKRFFQASMLR
jgi:hypothetical protein